MQLPKNTVLRGSSGRLPFNGEFYLRIELGLLHVEIIGRVGASLRPEDSWETCLNIREALKSVRGDDPLSATRAVWDCLLAIPRRDFGPNLGEDISIMVVARAEDRGALSAVGLNSIWSLSENDELTLVVGPDLPEVNTVGLPRLAPKALELHGSSKIFVGSTQATTEPDPREIASLLPREHSRDLP